MVRSYAKSASRRRRRRSTVCDAGRPPPGASRARPHSRWRSHQPAIHRGVRLAAVVAPGADDTRAAHSGLTVFAVIWASSASRTRPRDARRLRELPPTGPRRGATYRVLGPDDRQSDTEAEADPTAIKVLGSGNGHFSEVRSSQGLRGRSLDGRGGMTPWGSSDAGASPPVRPS
jgi:hypothetical protein